MTRFAFGRKGRRVVALGIAGLGACAVLAACSPVQMGSAAIVGNQRITVSSLDSQVSDLQASVTKYNSTLQSINTELEGNGEQLPVLSGTPLSRLVLNWQIQFAIVNQMAAAKGISISQAESQSALSNEVKGAGVSEDVYLTAIGIPVQMAQQAGTYLAQETALQKKYGTSNSSAIEKAQCSAAKTLNIQVSPQYGRFDYASATMSLVAGNDTLSRPEGTPSPADTEGLTPAAC